MSQHTSEIRTDSVSRVYAQALYEMAKETGDAQAMTDEIDQLGEMLRSEKQLMALLSTPAISEADRRGIIERIFKDKVSDTLYRFLQVVAAKNRLVSLPTILQAFGDIVTDQRGIVEVDIFVPRQLDDDQLAKVAKSIGDSLGGKEIAPHQYVDESLIGGMKIRIGDKMIDASVASQLRAMQQQIVKRSQTAAQAAIDQETHE